MSTPVRPRGVTALRHFLLVRGLLTAAAALIALRWPDEALVVLAAAAGVLFMLLGGLGAVVAARLRRRYPLSSLLVGEGASAMVFGLLSLLLPRVSFGAALSLALAWLVVYGGAVLLAWNALLRGRIMAPAVLAWGGANLLLSLVVIDQRWQGVDVLLYAGAGYAAVFSIAEIAAAVWLGRLPPVITSGERGGADAATPAAG